MVHEDNLVTSLSLNSRGEGYRDGLHECWCSAQDGRATWGAMEFCRGGRWLATRVLCLNPKAPKQQTPVEAESLRQLSKGYQYSGSFSISCLSLGNRPYTPSYPKLRPSSMKPRHDK